MKERAFVVGGSKLCRFKTGGWGLLGEPDSHELRVSGRMNVSACIVVPVTCDTVDKTRG